MKKACIVLMITTISLITVAQNNGLNTGYKGFFDLEFGLCGTGITTSHGYQLNPHFYVGAGVSGLLAFDRIPTDELGLIPVFLDFRATLLSKKTTPYFDMKIGYGIYVNNGFRINPSLGCRIGLSKKIGLNMGVGYVFQNYWKYRNFEESVSCINVTIGMDF